MKIIDNVGSPISVQKIIHVLFLPQGSQRLDLAVVSLYRHTCALASISSYGLFTAARIRGASVTNPITTHPQMVLVVSIFSINTPNILFQGPGRVTIR